LVAAEQGRTIDARGARAVDGYRDVIARFDVDGVTPEDLLPHRERLIDKLTEQVRPLLDAVVALEDAEAEIERLSERATLQPRSSLSTIAHFELGGARGRLRAARVRLRELLQDEEMVLRYALLRQLVRSDARREPSWILASG
jgi:hypothetical protein